MVSDKFYAIVAGVGPGTGRSVALRFSEAYPVVLLARHLESYDDVVVQINKAGGRAIGISTDATDKSSLASAFETIKKEFKNLQLVAAIYNIRPNSRPSRKPFLELHLQDLDTSLDGNVYVPIHESPFIRASVSLTECHIKVAVSSLLLKVYCHHFSNLWIALLTHQL
jgi:NAD(P)-dependent dehydrogenase (short-subunit alcohol dehydrogenase family)